MTHPLFDSFSPMAYNPGDSGFDSLITILGARGLTSNLKLCLDAGDLNSYSGSGQSWLDTAGGGYDFFRGATSSATTDDPTFNGTAGSLSANEYFSFDGGDIFRYDSANEAWMNNYHKDSALISMCFWVYGAGSDVNNALMGDSANVDTNVGIFLRAASSTNTLQFRCSNGSGTVSMVVTSAAIGYAASQWNFVGLSFDEAAGTGLFYCNGTTDAIAGTYSSPSAAAASFPMDLASRGNGNSLFTNGGRMAQVAMWEGGTPLTATDFLAIYTATRSRFGV